MARFDRIKLSMPNRTALSVVHIGEMLNIEYRQGPPGFLVVMTKDGRAAGALTGSSTPALMRSITQENSRYVAQVLRVNGLTCEVRVLGERYHRGGN